MGVKPDFQGWATKANVRCADGRTILPNAFAEDNGVTVPLVWGHQHNSPGNVLGHALLENRPEGVYAYGFFNKSELGQQAKELVRHGDIKSMSIYANRLKQDKTTGSVHHGRIREVSLVLAGANPEALIENTVLAHGEECEEEAIMRFFEPIEDGEDVLHMEEETTEEVEEVEEESEVEKTDDVEETDETVAHSEDDKKGDEKMAENTKPNTNSAEEKDDGETVQDIFDSMNEKQKNVVYYMIGKALEDKGDGDKKEDKEDDDDMKHNVFDTDEMNQEEVLSHDEMAEIIADAKRSGSLKDAVLQHGITNIDYLFPEAKSLNTPPDWIKRPDSWVQEVMGAVHHTPFSRIKSMFADITADEARAKGYTKGNRKTEEVFTLLKRTTTPTTIYKKQKLDRDDVIDITDFDVVAWIKTEMRFMLDEEIARAILVGDGRSGASDDKIQETNIRPVWTDDSLYTIPARIAVSASESADDKAKKFIRGAIKARKNYRGSGNPVLYTTEDMLTDILLLEDGIGRPLYDDVAKLATKLRVRKIVTVPVMENLSRTVQGVTYHLEGLIVNLIDYNVGADKGGAVNMFDDFDIDYNAQKYLIETRCSGALIKPFSAIAIETYVAATETQSAGEGSGSTG